MKNNLKSIRSCLRLRILYKTLIIFLVCLKYISPLYAQITVDKKVLPGTNLIEGFSYSAFTANDEYLAWAEFYKQEIYIYDLEEKKIIETIQSRGKGPHEYVMISSLALTPENKLLIADPNSIKIITYNISDKNFQRDIRFSNYRPFRITSLDVNRVFVYNDAPGTRNVNLLINLRNKEIDEISLSERKNESIFSNTFQKTGHITAKKKFGIHVTKYYPYIYVLNLETKKMIKKIVFDDTRTPEPRQITIKGEKALSAPEDVELMNWGVTFMPGSNQKILLASQGSGEKRSYSGSSLQIFDINEGKHIGTIPLGVKTRNIITNTNYLYVYSKEENQVYKYDFIK